MVVFLSSHPPESHQVLITELLSMMLVGLCTQDQSNPHISVSYSLASISQRHHRCKICSRGSQTLPDREETHSAILLGRKKKKSCVSRTPLQTVPCTDFCIALAGNGDRFQSSYSFGEQNKALFTWKAVCFKRNEDFCPASIGSPCLKPQGWRIWCMSG